MQPEQQQRIMGYFIEEAKDHLNTIEQGLLNLQSTIDDPEMVNEMFRAAHSVKGGAAMLGLQGIQQVSHRLEDFFKILKDSEVRVDQTMESSFLQVFDTLKEFVDQLQAPLGVTEEETQAALVAIEPVFKELEQQLSGAAGAPRTSVPMEYRPNVAVSTAPSLIQMFRENVPASLREMLALFKQPESDAVSRRQLQEICDRLHNLGVVHQIPSWCHLIESAQRAIGAPENTYRTLAPVIIKDIKQAQELVLAGRAGEVCPGPQLLALVPITAAQPALEPDFGDLFTAGDSTEYLTQSASDDVLFGNSDFDFEAADLGAASRLGSDSTQGVDASAFDLDPVFSEAALTAATEHDGNGPEVGIEELNTLADLFEGEMPDLGATWQEEELLGEMADGETFNPHSLAALEDTNDFSDLLFAETPTNSSGSQASSEDELNDLFGDVLDDVSEPSGLNAPGTFGDAFDLSGMPESEAFPSSSVSLSSDLGLEDLDLEIDGDADLEDLLAIPSNTEPEAALGDSAWDALEDSFDALDFSDLDNPSETVFNAEPTLAPNAGVTVERTPTRMEAPFDEMGDVMQDLFEDADVEELSLPDELSLSSQEMTIPGLVNDQPDTFADPWAEDINLSIDDRSTDDRPLDELSMNDLVADELFTDDRATVTQPWNAETTDTDLDLSDDDANPIQSRADFDLDMGALSELTSDDDALDFGDFSKLMDSELDSDLNVGDEGIELLVDGIPEQSIDDFFSQSAAEVQSPPELREPAEATVGTGEIPDPWSDSFDEQESESAAVAQLSVEEPSVEENIEELDVAEVSLDSIDLSDFAGLEQGEATDAPVLDTLDLDAFDWESTAAIATNDPEELSLNPLEAELSDDLWGLDLSSADNDLALEQPSVTAEIDAIANVPGLEAPLENIGEDTSFTNVPEPVSAFDELMTFDSLDELEDSVLTESLVLEQDNAPPIDSSLDFGADDLFDDALSSNTDDLFGEPSLFTDNADNIAVSEENLDFGDDELFGQSLGSLEDSATVSGESLDFGDDELFGQSLGSLEDNTIADPKLANADNSIEADGAVRDDSRIDANNWAENSEALGEDLVFSEHDFLGEPSLERPDAGLTLFGESEDTSTDDLFGEHDDLFGEQSLI